MQRLSLIVAIALLFLITIFAFESFLLKAITFSFIIIILFISGYLYEFKFTFALFCMVVFLTLSLIFFGLEILNVPILIFNFSIATLVSYFFQKSYLVSLREFKESLNGLNRKFSKLKEKDLKTLQKNKDLENKVNEIEDLYEITKDMSAALEFEKIFKILETVFKKRFEFKECTLIYVDRTEEGASRIRKILRINQAPPKEKTQITEVDKSLFAHFLKETKPILLRENSNRNLIEKFSLPHSLKTFIAVPLIVERELMGILSMVDLEEEDFEKFSIVAWQFALEMKKAILYEKVEELALNDGLTKLFVRRHFLKRLEEEIERSKRHKLPLAVLMLDIDHFKKCNDTYGHLVGDVVLREVAFIIKTNIREVDLAGRYGGEEFCVALPETDIKGARHVAERIREAVEEKKIRAYDEIIRVTASIGLSLYPKDNKEVTGLIEAADKALYKAKETGRNRVCEYEK
jgi:diguanylate cyclase (GGDEF)-like protein